MFVTKRDGRTEEVKFDKITHRINTLINPEEKKFIDPILIGQKVVAYLHSGITTEILDNESANICINLSTRHPLYSNLGGRILVSNLHKKIKDTFSEKVLNIQNDINFFDNDFYKFINNNSDDLNNMIDYSRDYMFDYFGFKTLERAYLIKNVSTTKIYETPQDMFLRVSSFLNQDSLEETKETYDLLSQGYYTHASPTLFNSGSKRSQLSSCFLLGTDDSIEGITKTWASVSEISKYGGGIGLHVSNIRSKGSIIRGTNGPSSGIIPMLQVYNSIARYINQCFVGTTKIYTEDGLTEIQKLKVGDKVFTSDGTLKEIKKIYNDNYNKEFIDINITYNFDIPTRVTPKHPFLVVKNKELMKSEWCEAKNININDLINIPIPVYEKDYELYDASDCYFYGIMMKYGNINELNQCCITTDNIYHVESIKKYLDLQLIKYTTSVKNNICSIEWSLSSKFKFSKNQFYNDNSKKFDKIILNLPLDKSKWMLKSIIDTNDMTITMSSLTLLESIKYLLLRMGVLTSGYLTKSTEMDSVKPIWVLNIPMTKEICDLLQIKNDNYVEFIRNGDILYTTIKSIQPVDKNNQYVYDLEITDNHNYLTEIGLVHNGGKRKGSIAIYLEPHHADIFEFLDLRKNFGDENKRARDLFLALWISDLFMKQVKDDGDWYLMCPDECKGLSDCWGSDYEELYWKYVSENKFREKIKARKLMKAIWVSQQETGTPYITYKDTANRKSNQQNLGTIKSSNLCNEIIEYSDANEHAVCNLGSIAINKMIIPFDYSNKKWIIYTKENCNKCKWAKALLAEYEYEEINTIDSSESLHKLFNIEKLMNHINNSKSCSDIVNKDNIFTTELLNNGEPLTYPQIFCKENDTLNYIGGFDELFNYTKATYDYEKLRQVAYIATRNLNKVIDVNYYPTIETKRSNFKNRPIGLGIQGMADAIAELKIEFESEECIDFNKKYMETIYLGAMQCSVDIAEKRSYKMVKLINLLSNSTNSIPEFYLKTHKWDDEEIDKLYHDLKPQKIELLKNSSKTTVGSYASYEGSPLSNGIFQFNMWGIDVSETNYPKEWTLLKEKLKLYGARNSLVTALMPTASTSQILGNNECFELFTSNIYTRNTLAGDFPIVNKYLVNDLIKINEWNTNIKDLMIADNGSIQNIKSIPTVIKNLYKTQWEIKQIWVLKTAKARGPFVDQTQSMNVFLEKPDDQKLNSCLFWGWENGLKTGMYYLRSKPSSNATKITVDPTIIKQLQDDEICENCSA